MHLDFIDLFCGIGGFHHAAVSAAKAAGWTAECVFACDIDEHCQQAYKANFNREVHADIKKVEGSEVPDHGLLLAGFPCQPFSIIGDMKGFMDTRGTLFHDIERILRAKRPRAFVLENVKMLRGHDGGRTLETILGHLRALDYAVDFRVFNALNFGLPQKRERIWIVGLPAGHEMVWPVGKKKMTPLSKILEKDVPKKFYASEAIRESRHALQTPDAEPTIWHENVAGHVSKYPYSCALRAGASYNYLLVNGERRLTPREMLRLQGFPDSHKIVVSDAQARRQAGNSLPVPVARAVIAGVIASLKKGAKTGVCQSVPDSAPSKNTTHRSDSTSSRPASQKGSPKKSSSSKRPARRK